jgi:CheY-like chemotaxis protein
MNLILNAKDAMHGKGIIKIRTFRCSGSSGDSICLQISDTGAGIDEQDLSRIFDPFFTTKDVGKGTGLGLSIVYSVVKSHGGDISVNSRKGEGSTFSITLPVGDSSGTDDSPFYHKLPLEQNPGIRGRETILFVEDEDILRDLLSNFLTSLGYSIVTASDGKEAVTVYEKDPGRFSIIISDMTMPNMGGIELFQKVRSIDPAAKFILVTGYSLADVDQNLLAAMTSVQKKPYTPIQIAKLVRGILDSCPS